MTRTGTTFTAALAATLPLAVLAAPEAAAGTAIGSTVGSTAAATARASTPAASSRGDPPAHGTRTGAAVPPGQTRTARTLPACEDEPEWRCGTVRVPVDRARPGGRTIAVAFAVLPRSDTAAMSAAPLFMTTGGPGFANSNERGFFEFLAGDLTEDRDLVVVDHRGTGLSGAIDCPAAQASDRPDATPAQVNRAVRLCADQLGADADRYGSGDVALDVDAVRDTLGYPRISIWAQSYGGVFLAAYASRFPHRIASAVIDSGTPATDPRHAWTWAQDTPGAAAAGVALDCRRSPACAVAQPRARSALTRLAAAVRRHPVRGGAVVPGAGPRRITVDERALIELADNWWTAVDLAAAAAALDRGDTRPLLRLAAENQTGAAWEAPDPRSFSVGANAAAYCNDVDPVWDRADPLPVRRAKYRHARTDLARQGAFAPYSAKAWTEYFRSYYCLRWPTPDRFTPAIPAGHAVTGVPTLILSGDRDTVVPTATTRELVRVFPQAHFMRVAGAAHPASGWSDCGREAFQEFVRNPQSPVGRCDDPAYVPPASSTFPRLARMAIAAKRRGADRSTVLARKVATVVVQAARDAVVRSTILGDEVGVVAGLRGGRARYDNTPSARRLTLQRFEYAADVAVSGRIRQDPESNKMTFRVRVAGPRRLDGALRATGTFGPGPPYADFRVAGALAGRRVSVAVPAN